MADLTVGRIVFRERSSSADKRLRTKPYIADLHEPCRQEIADLQAAVDVLEIENRALKDRLREYENRYGTIE